jgi:hypothetical protein
MLRQLWPAARRPGLTSGRLFNRAGSGLHQAAAALLAVAAVLALGAGKADGAVAVALALGALAALLAGC